MRFEIDYWKGAWNIIDNTTEDGDGGRDVIATAYSQRWVEKIRDLLEAAEAAGGHDD